MKIKEIQYVFPSSQLVEDCIDVIVTLDDSYCKDGFGYVVEATTPEFLATSMEREKSKFLSPTDPYIIVSELTDETIRAALQKFVDTEGDSYWLKLYHIPAQLDIVEINEILERKKQEQIAAELDRNDY